MLKANVGLSRKVSRNYDSTGFTVNLEGEITASPNDPKAVLNQIHQLYRLAEDALAKQIDRVESEDALGRRDEEPHHHSNGNGNGRNPGPDRKTNPTNGNHRSPNNGQDEQATNKQVQFLLSLGKRHGLTKVQLEEKIEDMLGKRLTIYQISKKEAARIIDDLNQTAPVNGHR